MGRRSAREIILDQDLVSSFLPLRPAGVHKYTSGRVLVLAGSRGMTGAAILATRAALRAGAGLVTLAAPSGLSDLIDVQIPEVLTLPMPDNYGTLAPSTLDILKGLMRKFDCILIGPGLNTRTAGLIADVLQFISNRQTGLRVVLDADGLRALSLLQRRRLRMRLILTPHAGELAGLLNVRSAVVRRAPALLARKAAARHNAVVVLKNADKTYITADENRYFLNNNGNPGLATAGSGDVLAGIIAGLWVSTPGMTALRAAAAGPYVHGLAGNLAAEEYSVDGIVAGDIPNFVPQALKILKGE